MRLRRLAAGLAAAALGLGAGATPAAVTATPDACVPDPAAARALGPGCRTGDGLYWVRLADGTLLPTHGGDTGGVASGSAPVGTITPRPVACTGLDEDHIRVIYARPQDLTNNYSRMAGEIRSMVEEANGIIRTDAWYRKRVVNMRVFCTRGKISVDNAVLPTPAFQADFSTIVSDLRDLGYRDERVKYLIWYDDLSGRFPGGMGTLWLDDSSSMQNRNNFGPGYAVTFGRRAFLGGTGIMLHELGHTLGAVQNSSPNTTRAGHCNDGLDIMCYDDGGITADFSSKTCKGRSRFDCHLNDYFDPRPASKSYLGTHWNLGSPLNRWFEGCMYKRGRIDAGLGGQRIDDLSSTTFAVPSACWGHRYALRGELPLPTLEDSGAPYGFFQPGYVHQVTQAFALPKLSACWFRGSKGLGCHSPSETGWVSWYVPKGATRVKVVLERGASTTFSLNAI